MKTRIRCIYDKNFDLWEFYLIEGKIPKGLKLMYENQFWKKYGVQNSALRLMVGVVK